MWSKKWLFFVAAFAVPMMMLAEEAPSFLKRGTEFAFKLKNGDDAGAVELLRKMEQEGLAPEKPHEIALGGEKGEMSLLITAAAFNSMPAVDYLLEKGADVDFAASDGRETQTPLCMALSAGNFDIAKYLIEKGADVNLGVQKMYNGAAFEESPLALALHACVHQRKYDLPFLRFLLEKGAEPKVKTCLRSGNAAKPQSLYCLLGNDGTEFALRLVELRVEPVAAENPPAMTKDGKIRIDSFYGGDLDVTLGKYRAQLAAGADPNSPEQFGELAKLGSKAIPVFEYLRHHGADYSKSGLNALCWTADVQLAEYLISHGVPADGVLENRYRQGDRETVEKSSPLSSAVAREKPELVQYLLEHGAAVRNEAAPENVIWEVRFGNGEKRDAIVRAFAAAGLRFTEEEQRKIAETDGALEYARKEGLIP